MKVSITISCLAFCLVAVAAPVFDETVGGYTDPLICGIFSRENGLIKKCPKNNIQFYIKGNQLAVSPTGDPKLDSTAQCDHSLELQVSKHVIVESGTCAAIDKMWDAAGLTGSGQPELKQKLFLPLFDAINDTPNAVWIPKGVNGEKATVVASLMQGQPINPKLELQYLPMIKTYYTNDDIKKRTAALATKLDELLVDMVTKEAPKVAIAALKAKQKSTTGRAASKLDESVKKINKQATDWETGLGHSGETMSVVWGRVLNGAPGLK